jgi:hypothetical protein
MLKSNLVGERDSKSAENDIELWHPGNKAYLLGFIEYFKNTPMVLLVKELDETYVRVIGSDGLPAALEVGEITTGNAVKDSKGAKLSFKSIGRVAPIYAGLIQVKTALLLALDFAGGGIGYVGYGNNTFTISLTSLTPDPTFFVWDNANPVHKLTVIGDLPTGTTAVLENGKIKVTGVLSTEGLFVFRLLGQTTSDGTPTGTVLESYGFDMTIDVLA